MFKVHPCCNTHGKFIPFLAEKYPIVRVDHILFVYSSTDGHFGLFPSFENLFSMSDSFPAPSLKEEKLHSHYIINRVWDHLIANLIKQPSPPLEPVGLPTWVGSWGSFLPRVLPYLESLLIPPAHCYAGEDEGRLWEGLRAAHLWAIVLSALALSGLVDV